MQIKRVVKSIGIVFGGVILIIVGILIFTATRLVQTQKRAETFCNKVEINMELSSIENIFASDSPDRIIVLSGEGSPLGSYIDYRKLKVAEISSSATGLLVIYQSGTPAYSGCEIQFSNKKILSKKIINRD